MEFPYVCLGVVTVPSMTAAVVVVAAAVLLVKLHSELKGCSEFTVNLVPPLLGFLCPCLVCSCRRIFLQRNVALDHLYWSVVRLFLSSVPVVLIFPFQYLFSVLHRLLKCIISPPAALNPCSG